MDYSVIIRTTGKAGKKYQQLLDSISKLEPQPKEVIVVLPEGYKLPKEQLGYETFCFCPKGMVIQRMTGINNCKSPYALITDDDISFDKDFVLKLARPIIEKGYALSAGPLIEFFPAKGFPSIMAAVTGSAIPTIFHKDRYNTVLLTTGYSYNRKLEKKELYETQSAPWTCFFADIEKLKSIHFEDEMIWLDKNGYSAHDDTAMFYKAWINGCKAVIVADATYEHLDAKTSIKEKKNNDYVYLSIGFNTYVFWYRFIFSDRNLIIKAISYLSIYFRFFMESAYYFLNCKRKKMNDSERKAYIDGFSLAKKWVKENEYKQLSDIRCV